MIRNIRADWKATILVCGKCTKKLHGGFGKKGRASLAEKLRDLGNGRKGRKANFGVIETGCLKICPKKAVVALNAARPHEWIIVSPCIDVREVADRLGLTGALKSRSTEGFDSGRFGAG